MLKKLFIFSSLFFISAFPAYACTSVATPDTVPINTRTPITLAVSNLNSATTLVGFNCDYTNGSPNGGTVDCSVNDFLNISGWTNSGTNNEQNWTQDSQAGVDHLTIGADYQFNSLGDKTFDVYGVNGGHTQDTCDVTIHVVNPNQPPTVNSISNTTINEGDTYSASGSFTDGDSTSWTGTVDYGDGSGSQALTLSGTNFSLSHTYTTAGQFTVTVNVTDNQGATGTGTATISVNAPPNINTFSGATINEGDTYTNNSSFTDSDSTSWTATVDYGDGSGSQALTLSGTNFSLSHVYKDNGTYTVTVRVTDNQGATGTGTATITVNNVVPTVGTITASVNPVQVNTSTPASANFTDPGVLDTHTASWNWGDGNTTTGTVTESNGSGSVSDSHTYTSSGVYPITLTVTDNNGGSVTQTFQYLSVYNPTSQGLFSAGQHFTSPAGAYSQNTSLTGTVKFGLSYKYQGTMPVGDKQFTMNFNAASLTFNATTISSLVIANSQASLTGTGTINGSGTYNFLVTGVDGGGIRVQITDPANNNNVIYDTQPGAAATATPTTSVTGHVIVHN